MVDIAGNTIDIAKQKLSKTYPGYFFETLTAHELGISENITNKYFIEEIVALSYFEDENNKKLIIKCVNKLRKR